MIKLLLWIVPEALITFGIVAGATFVIAGLGTGTQFSGNTFWYNYKAVFPFISVAGVIVWCIIGSMMLMDERHRWMHILDGRAEKKRLAEEALAKEALRVLKASNKELDDIVAKVIDPYLKRERRT